MASRNILLGSSRAFEAFSTPAGQQIRCLSATASREARHHVVKFQYSTPELHQTLKTIREKIIIPSYLDASQKAKVYDYRCQKELELDPIVLDVDGEEFKFGYINPRTDLPDSNQLVQQAVQQMTTKGDITNVPPLLEGLKQARRSVSWKVLPKIVRRAGLADALKVLVEAAVQVERTNFRLIHSEVVNQLLCWIQKKALDSQWDKKETVKALEMVQKVLDSMEENEANHTKGLTWNDGMTLRQVPLYRDPQVLAARLHLAAVLAVKHYDGKDLNGAVTKYAAELVALWPQGAGLLDIHPKQAYTRQQDMGYLVRASGRQFGWFAAPILHGLKLAAEVVDPKLSEALLDRAAAVEKEIKEAKGQDESVSIYDQLFSTGKTETAAVEAEE